MQPAQAATPVAHEAAEAVAADEAALAADATPQAAAPVPATAEPAFVARISDAAAGVAASEAAQQVVPEIPVAAHAEPIVPRTVDARELESVVSSAGLQWVQTRAGQLPLEESVIPAARPQRQRKPKPAAPQEPLTQVETRSDEG